MSETPKRTSVWKWLIAVLVLLAPVLYFISSKGEDLAGDQPAFKAVRGPLDIKIIETGTINPQEQLVIVNELQGQTTIISLIAEGTRVKVGDLLVELDSSRLLDERIDQQIKVQNAEATFVRARENLAVTKNQTESDISKATLDLRFAKEDQSQYIEGQYPNQLREAESRIALAEEELKRADEKLKWSEILSAEKYISTTELQADRLAARRTGLDLELAKNAMTLLQDYTHTRRLVELESAISQIEMALERVKRKAAADIIQAEADLHAKESELSRQKDKLSKLEDQIKKSKITAPRDGLVVYATSVRMSYRGNSDPLQEGQQVRERQELIFLPTNIGMKADFKIQETQLSLIKIGQTARIKVDAAADSSYTGQITSIAPLPDATQMWLNPDLKVYATQVKIDGLDESLRTGMSCKVEVLVESYADVLQIPIQAVIRSGRHALVYVRQKSGEFVAKEVDVGFDNGSLIHVKSGLQAGEEVWLAPPLEAPAGFVYVHSDPVPESKASPVSRPNSNVAETSASGEPKAAMGQDENQKQGGRSEEEKQKMRERMNNMSPEEREKMRSSFRQKRQAGEQQRP